MNPRKNLRPYVAHRFWTAITSISLVTIGVTLAMSTGSAGASPATGSPLVFGVVATQTGVAGSPEQGQAMEAYAANWNAHGGYKGHRIQVIIRDGDTDATATASAARQLVIQSNVLAMIENYNLLDCSVNTSYYASVPIGVVDAQLGVGCFNPSIDFPTQPPSGTVGLSAAVKWGVEHGSKSLGLIVPNIPQVDSLVTAMKAYAAKVHKPLNVQEVPLAPTAADLDPAYVSMKSAGVDMVVAVVGSAPLVYQEAIRQSFGPSNGVKWVFTATSLQGAPASTFSGAYQLISTYPWDSTNPGVVAARKVLKGIKLDALSTAGYQAMGMLQQVLGTIKGPVTRASILQALRHDDHVALPLTSEIVTPATPDKNPEGGVMERSVKGSWKVISGFVHT